MSDLYHLQARLRAMRGRLFARAGYDRLLASPDIPGIAAALRETPYGPYLGSSGGGISDAARIDEALRRNFQDALFRLHYMSSGECREGIRLLLETWEIQTVKTVLRGKASGRTAEEILSSAVPTGLHGEAALQELCRMPNVQAVVDLLATWRDPWSRPLSRAMKEYRSPRDLFVLETALDRFRAVEASARLRKVPRRPRREEEDALSLFLALVVDGANAATAIKVVEEGISPGDAGRYFLPGGRIYARRDFDRILSSKSVPDALERAAKFRFAKALRDIPAPPAGVPVLAAVERRLERALIRAMRAQVRQDPLGWGMAAGYLLDKACEIRNVRMIVRGRQAGLTDPDLKELLILPE